MTQTVEELRYQLEEWLAQGFTSPEDRANYQAKVVGPVVVGSFH